MNMQKVKGQLRWSRCKIITLGEGGVVMNILTFGQIGVWK